MVNLSDRVECTSGILATINPLEDDRWADFVRRHPHSSIFHTSGWFRALHDTYGYKPIVFTTTTSDGPLRNGIPFCHVDSWLTGSRLVSTAFADHCQPLYATPEELDSLLILLQEVFKTNTYKYFELRPLNTEGGRLLAQRGFAPTASFNYHWLPLTAGLDDLFGSLHKSCIQRKIHRAETKHLRYETDHSDDALKKFYSLHILTRRRHGLVPQPISWFRNLSRCFGDALKLHLVYREQHPIAAVMTLRHKTTIVYKYGCSNATFHNLGSMPLLFWRIIRDAKESGAEQLDLGRSDLNNDGLARFKMHLGARSAALTYYRYPEKSALHQYSYSYSKARHKLLMLLPDNICVILGKALYRHVG